MASKADEYKDKVAVAGYKEMTRKVGVLSRISVRQLLGTRPEADSRTEYMTGLAMKTSLAVVQTEVLLELALTKLGVTREDFLKAMMEKMAETVKDLEEDLCVTSWDQAGNPIFDLEKYAQRSATWPK